MPVSAKKFKPGVNPETWISPTTACRLSVALTAARFQTLDERFTNASGKPYSKRQLTRVLRALRDAAAAHKNEGIWESDGYNRGDALAAYAAIFPGLEAISADPTPAGMKWLLEHGWFLSVSGNVKHTSATCPLRQYVNPVAHEIGLARLNGDGTQVLVYEPMRPDKPVWVKWTDVVRFSREFKNDAGQRVCIKFKIAKFTKAAAALRLTKEALRRLRTVRAERNGLIDTVDTLADEIISLEQTVTDLRNQLGDTAAIKREARTEALNDAIVALEDIRDEDVL